MNTRYSHLPKILLCFRRRYWGDMSELIADDVIDSLNCISSSRAFYTRYVDVLLEMSGNLDSGLS